jgi:COP9 signalosome complex subunit 3
MSAELTTILLSFQPDSPELVKRRDYDTKARQFVSQLSNISSTSWTKGADTQQDVLSVRKTYRIGLQTAEFLDT